MPQYLIIVVQNSDESGESNLGDCFLVEAKDESDAQDLGKQIFMQREFAEIEGRGYSKTKWKDFRDEYDDEDGAFNDYYAIPMVDLKEAKLDKKLKFDNYEQ